MMTANPADTGRKADLKFCYIGIEIANMELKAQRFVGYGDSSTDPQGSSAWPVYI